MLTHGRRSEHAAAHLALGVAPNTVHVLPSTILSGADWSDAPMLVTASKQVPLLMVGEFGLGGIPTAVGQFSPYRSPGHSERTSGADRGSKGKRGGDR